MRQQQIAFAGKMPSPPVSIAAAAAVNSGVIHDILLMPCRFFLLCSLLVLLPPFLQSAVFASAFDTANAAGNLTTVLVCEGGLASLHCPPQHEIAVHLANFGRFSLHTCNKEMRMDLNTQCHNPRTIEVLRASCDHHRECNLQVSSEVFGSLQQPDVCPGSEPVKPYLEATFKCVPSKVTTTTSTTTTTLSTSAATASGASVALPFAGNLPFDGGGREVLDGDDDVDADGNGGIGKSKEDKKSAHGCAPRTVRGLRWHRTPFGQTVRQPCPRGSRGQAEWHCSVEEGRWMPAHGPNLGRCTSDWARELRDELDEIGIDTSREQRQNWFEVLNEEQKHVRREELIGGDVQMLGDVLAEVVKRLVRKRNGEMADDHTSLLVMAAAEHGSGGMEARRAQQQETLKFVGSIVDTIGHLLRTNQRAAWLDLDADQRQTLAAQLLQTIPQTLSLLLPLATWPKAGSESIVAEPTLVAEVAQASIYDYVPFPSMSLYRQNFDTVLLPREALQMYGQDLANVFYTAWDRAMGTHLLGSDDWIVISKVVGIMLVPLNGKLIPAKQLPSFDGTANGHGSAGRGRRPVVLTFQTVEESGRFGSSNGEPRCAWWDAEANKFVTDDDADGEKATTSENDGGCTLVEHNQTHIVCECGRVNTHFAVLAGVQSSSSDRKAAIWQWITRNANLYVLLFFVACLIAFCCLLLAILIQCTLQRPAQRTKGEQIKCALTGDSADPLASKCRHHICLVLLALEAVFLLRMAVPEQQFVCHTLAFCRDYLLLACLCWTAFDELQFWRNVRCFAGGGLLRANRCQQFGSALRRCGTLLCGFGVPLLLLVVLTLLFPIANPTDDEFALVAVQQQRNDGCWPLPALHHHILFTLTGSASLLLVITICGLAHAYWTLRTSNSKSAQHQRQQQNINKAIKMFGAVGGGNSDGSSSGTGNGYQPCSTTTSTNSSNGSSATTTNGIGEFAGISAIKQHQREERRLLGQLRRQLRRHFVRLVALSLMLLFAVCWAIDYRKQQQQGMEDGGGKGGSEWTRNTRFALVVASAFNVTIAALALADVLTNKNIRTSYQRWRHQRFGPNRDDSSTALSSIVGFLHVLFCTCCCSSNTASRKRCCSSSFGSTSATHASGNAKGNNNNESSSSTEFLPSAAKFAAQSPLNTTSSSTTTSRTGGGAGGENGENSGEGGAQSACSEMSTTMEMQLSTGSAANDGSGMENGGGCAIPNCHQQQHNLYRPHPPPPPAPLLQLYQEHKMLLQQQQRNGGRNNNGSCGGSGCCSPAQQQRANNSGSNSLYNASHHQHQEPPADSNAESIYEYATIPYEELLTAYHHQQQQQHQQQQPCFHPGIAGAGCCSPLLLPNGHQQCVSSTTSTLMGARPIATPRLNTNNNNGGQQHQQPMMTMMPYLGNGNGMSSIPLPAAVRSPVPMAFAGNQHSIGPLPVRLSMIGAQQVAVQQQQLYPIPQFNDEHVWQQHANGGDLPPIREMGLHSAPPNFPPPPPPAPPCAAAAVMHHHNLADQSPFPATTFVDPIHFRRSSSGSVRSNTTSNNSTLVLRMDLSRPKPVFSERIDSVVDEEEEEE